MMESGGNSAVFAFSGYPGDSADRNGAGDSGPGYTDSGYLIGFAGCTMLWLFIFCLMGITGVATESAESAYKPFATICMIAVFVLCVFKPQVLSSRKIRTSITVVVCIALMLLSVSYRAFHSTVDFCSVPGECVLVYCMRGAVAGFAYVQLGVFLSGMQGFRAAIVLLASSLLAGLGGCVLTMVPLSAARLTADIALCASQISFAVLPMRPETHVRPAELFRGQSLVGRLAIEIALLSMVYGLFASLFGFLAEGAAPAFGLSLVYVIPAALLLTLTCVAHTRMDFNSVRSLLVPAFALTLLPIVAFGAGACLGCVLVVIALFQILECSSILAFTELVREQNLPPISSFSLLRLIGTLGLFAGRIASVPFIEAEPEILDGRLTAVVLALSVILVVWICLQARVELREVKSETAFPDSRLSEEGFMDNRASEQPGRWRRRCFSLADQYGLSEREVDIFILLAKGRNAPYIGKQLYVSESTVRSHIQHIYAKMDIHSQQDLIDLVEREQ